MELMDREGLADAARHALLELVPPAIALVRACDSPYHRQSPMTWLRWTFVTSFRNMRPQGLSQ